MKDLKEDALRLFEKYTFLQLKVFSVTAHDASLSKYESEVLKMALDMHRADLMSKLDATKTK